MPSEKKLSITIFIHVQDPTVQVCKFFIQEMITFYVNIAKYTLSCRLTGFAGYICLC